jgi:predicted DNA-binding transcriptional regulator YafY
VGLLRARQRSRNHRRAIGRGNTLARTLLVLGELTRRAWTLSALAAHLGVGLRTVYRDVEVIAEVGIEIRRDGHRRRVSRASVRRVMGI